MRGKLRKNTRSDTCLVTNSKLTEIRSHIDITRCSRLLRLASPTRIQEVHGRAILGYGLERPNALSSLPMAQPWM